MTRTSTIALALVSALWLTGCASAVRIAEIKTDPGRFDDKTVAVTGTVTSSFGVPLVPFQLYNVDDGTGEIAVLSRTLAQRAGKGRARRGEGHAWARWRRSAAAASACTSKKRAGRARTKAGLKQP